MAWDKNLPSGSANIAQGDNAIRDNNQAIETALGQEHEFSTGGTNGGRHKFGEGNAAAQAAITNWVGGSVYFRTDLRSGKIVIQKYSGSAWVDIDIYQPTTIPRLTEQSPYSVTQWGTWASVTPGAGSPDTLAIDLALSPYKYATIVGDTIISNPTNPLASNGTTCLLFLTMSGAGHVITWGSNYRTPGGVTPAVAAASGAKTLVYIQSCQDGTYAVTTLPGLAAI